MRNILKIMFCTLLVVSMGSCEDILEVVDISDEPVVLLAPAEGVIVTDSLVSFNWNGIDEADAYLIQVATPSFENASQILLDSVMVIDSTFQGTRISKVLSNNDYQWRVQAYNSGYQTEFSTHTFSVSNTD
ncbi:hypothetical protein HZY62_15345 [Maribacter polysiphoniae]|uniref:Fibronectin type-III domain-containing protein n=1 Tax=Maribacter polysiphoniae TaxID=429344 RepID=A0A316DWG1_9FLAO|nr:hypothetical protein [Maribacter polysiphoniae]MBD1261977.1 hypothetical protein [Maribacter polysiphoniae]PWK21662.1 hypothetical protein LX92_03441 [Maribacter polysiphoniae]